MAPPSVCPTTQSADLFIHGFGQRNSFGERMENVRSRYILSAIESVIQCTVYRFLDLRTAELLAAVRQRLEIEARHFPTALQQMDAKDFDTFLAVRQID